MIKYCLPLFLSILFFSCTSPKPESSEGGGAPSPPDYSNVYTEFTLTTDVSGLNAEEKRVIPILIEAAKIMDVLFWKQAYGDKNALLASIENEALNWMKSVFGFPKDAVGNLTSGGSIANLIALTAARDKHQIKNEKINI